MSFILQLYGLTHDLQAGEEGVKWSPDGTYFTIANPTKFAHQVLPRYFKHKNYTSFIRQLNTYGMKDILMTGWIMTTGTV